MVLILLVLLRAIIGPTVIDRLLSINAISSKEMCIRDRLCTWKLS